VAALVSSSLGNNFDMEVWNEYPPFISNYTIIYFYSVRYTFGSNWLSDANYYNPARTFEHYYTYNNSYGQSISDKEAILPLTVDYMHAVCFLWDLRDIRLNASLELSWNTSNKWILKSATLG